MEFHLISVHSQPIKQPTEIQQLYNSMHDLKRGLKLWPRNNWIKLKRMKSDSWFDIQMVKVKWCFEMCLKMLFRLENAVELLSQRSAKYQTRIFNLCHLKIIRNSFGSMQITNMLAK